MNGEHDFDRLLVRALRTPEIDPIPHDFAAQTAARAEGRGAHDDRLERWLQCALILLLGGGSTWAILEFSARWPGLRPASNWGAAILACLALSSALDQWRGRKLRT